jgi:hypothetical protein
MISIRATVNVMAIDFDGTLLDPDYKVEWQQTSRRLSAVCMAVREIRKLVSSVSVPQTTGQVVRYVGPVEARIAQESGFIPVVDRFGNPKTVFVSPEAPLSSVAAAEQVYQIGKLNPMGATSTPTHVIVGDGRAIMFDYGGNVLGCTGIEMTTTQSIPVIRVMPIGGNP